MSGWRGRSDMTIRRGNKGLLSIRFDREKGKRSITLAVLKIKWKTSRLDFLRHKPFFFPDFEKWVHTVCQWWFCDFSESKATSPNSQTKGERPPLAAPFGTDNSPTWEREPDSFSHNKDQVNWPDQSSLPCLFKH